jgi:hypothetical protein
MFVTADMPRGRLVKKVTLDDVDVTRDCYAADDELGYVVMFKRDLKGNYVVEQDGWGWRVQSERRDGKVVIEGV